MDNLLKINMTASRSYSDQIKEQLKAHIRQGELSPGDKIPSIRRMSDELGVSIGIVQRAVGSLIEENYLRSHQGRGIFVSESRLHNQTIALVLPTCEIESMPRFIRGVKDRLRNHTSSLVVISADNDFDEEVDMIRHLDRPFLSGAVIYPPPMPEVAQPLNELQQRGLPYVLLDSAVDGVNAEAVVCDWRELGRLLVRPLLEKGHRRIGVLDGNVNHPTRRLFRLGMDEMLQTVGSSFATLPCILGDATDINTVEPWKNGERMTHELLDAYPDLTAVITTGEYPGLGAYRAIAARGLRIPDDISLIVKGDLQIFSMLTPGITAVEIPHKAMAGRATERLLELLDNEITDYREECLPPVLNLRDSIADLR